MKKRPFGLYLAAFGIVVFLLALIGVTEFSGLLALILLLAVWIYSIFRLVSAIRQHRPGQIVLILVQMAAMLLIVVGLWGVAVVHGRSKVGSTYSDNLFGVALLGEEGAAYTLRNEYGMMYVGFKYAQNRVALLIVGLLPFLAPFAWNLYRKMTGQVPMGAQTQMGGQMPAGGQPSMGNRAPIQPQQFVQSAQQGLQNVQRSLQAAHQQFRAVQQYAQQAVQQPGGLIREDRCCICGGRFRNGFAVLFTLPDGREARIDEDCWSRINTIHNGTDPMQITQINSYFYGRMNMVDSTVVPYLQNYIQTGNQRLAQGMQYQPPQS